MANISVISLEEKLIPASTESGRIEVDESRTVVDFSHVERLDSNSLASVRDLAKRAGDSESKVIVRGMSVEVYKALKLAKLTSGFSFSD